MSKTTDNIFITKIFNFFNYLNNISLDNLMPNDGIIFIFVPIALISIVVFADIMKIDSILDSPEDFERRRYIPPINLVYTYVTRPYIGSRPVPLIIDLNDVTGLRMKALFIPREIVEIGNFRGFSCRNISVDNQGVLRTNANRITLDALEAANKGVKSKGPIPNDSIFVNLN
ncbi:MAG: hypothetical protein EOP34_06305 [Rickettsiales bacterium]|nr:MAG: hypothetical protein EOP34_06305 [Rickettsiales bacterium]